VDAAVVAVAGIAGATGRTERTVRTIASFESLKRAQPLKVLPLHRSQLVPGGTRMLFTFIGDIFVRGPSIVWLKP